MQIIRKFLCALALGGVIGVWGAGDGFSEWNFSDNQAELTNPDMGFTHYQYDDGLDVYGSQLLPEDTLADWPGMSTVYIRIPWSLLEPEEGKFCWFIIDDQLRKFQQRGLKIGLRFTVTESFVQDATPQWVQDAGAKGNRFTHGVGLSDTGERWEPDYGDPIFLEKLENFLRAAARRYNNPDEVAFVDVGTFGIWGEGHTWLGTSLAFPDEVVKKHIDLHVKYFDRVPVLGESGFLERKGGARPAKSGTARINYVFSIPRSFAGKRYELRVVLNNPYTGNLMPELARTADNSCSIGFISFDADGTPKVEKNPLATLPESVSESYAVTLDQLEYDPALFRYSGKIHVTFRFKEPQPPHVTTDLTFHDPVDGTFVSNAKEERFGGELLAYMKARKLGYRDDSVLVSPRTAAIQGAYIMEEFWRQKPIVLEIAHFDHILNNRGWIDGGEDMYRAVADNHASQISIHHWPREFLRENRELVRRINQIIGYRYNLTQARVKLTVPGRLQGRLEWKNVGVAPAYRELYPTLTLKNDHGGIVGSFTLDNMRLDQLMPGTTVGADFDFAIPEILYARYRQMAKGDEYNLYISAGTVTGAPLIELPLDNPDGQKRYKLSRIKVQ